MSLLDRALVPVANEEDTETTCQAIEPYLDEIGRIVLVHIVEQTEGYPDPAPPDVLEDDAQRFLAMARERLGEEIVDGVEIRFGTDITVEIAEMAQENDATAIVFRPREKGLVSRLLDASTEGRLIRSSSVPVVALPPG